MDAKSGQKPQAQLSVSPRIGFIFNIPEEKIRIKGGIGLFTGRIPLVWPGGAYNNTGVSVGGIGLNASAINALPSFTFRSDPFNQYLPQDVNQTFNPPSGQIDLVADGFKLPKVMKANLGFEKILGKGFSLQFDALFTKNINEVDYKNVFAAPGLQNAFGQTTYLTSFISSSSFTYNRIDQDPRVAGNQSPYSEGIFIITNAKGKKGYAYNFSLVLDKAFSKGWAANVSYSYGDSYSIFDGTSSQNNSNWRFMETKTGRSNLELSRSDFAQLHRFNAYVSKKFNYCKNMATSITLFYNGQTGSPFSYVYSRSLIFDRNGAIGESNDLIYVPKDLTDWQRFAVPTTINGVSYSVDQQWVLFDKYIMNDKYLSKRRGQFAERNGSVLPFSHIIDARIQQDFVVKTGKVTNKFSLIFDVFNFTNLINRTWGKYYRSVGVDQFSLVAIETNNYRSTLTNGQLVPQMSYRNQRRSAADIQDVSNSAYNASRWRGQLTLRYAF